MATITDLGINRPKTDREMTYLKKNIDEAIRQKLWKKDVYESYMQKIYHIIVVQINKQLQDKAESDATFLAFETDQYRIGYLMILKRICFSNQY